VQSGQTGAPAQYWLFEAKTKHLVAGPANTRAELTSFPGVKSLAGMRVLTTPARRVVVTCSAETAVVCPGPPGYSNEVGTSYYLFDDEPTAARPSPALTGAQLRPDTAREESDPTIGTPVVVIQFTPEGDRIFHRMTRDEAVRGRALGPLQHLAIVLDDELRSFPSIDYQQYPDGIDPSGGGAQITGLFSKDDAKNLALVLQTGALPVDFVVVSRKAFG
jgi:hypothetical protein